MRGRTGRRWLLGAITLLALGAAGWALQRRAELEGRAWVIVERADLVESIDVSGVLSAVSSIRLGPPQVEGIWEYKVTFLAPEGTEVRAGMPVARFDTAELERQLLERQAEAEQAAKELEKKAAELARRREDSRLSLANAEAALRKQRLKNRAEDDSVAAIEQKKGRLDLTLTEREVEHQTAKLELEERQGKAELERVRQRRDRAAARVRELEDGIVRMTILAPRDGTVIYPSEEGDERIKVGDTVWGGRTVLEIPDLSRLSAEGEVDEGDSGRLAAGQVARLSLDALPGVEILGKVESVSPSIEPKAPGSIVKALKVEIALEATDPERMRPGMRFRGTLEMARHLDVLSLPIEAVELSPEGARVRRRSLLGQETLLVELGRWGRERVEVLRGLAAGDRVLRSGEEAP